MSEVMKSVDLEGEPDFSIGPDDVRASLKTFVKGMNE
jgi:hypothetical protein